MVVLVFMPHEIGTKMALTESTTPAYRKALKKRFPTTLRGLAVVVRVCCLEVVDSGGDAVGFGLSLAGGFLHGLDRLIQGVNLSF